ncbi:hypothetical protein GON09_000001 [Rhodococcus sp. B50]|nr:hypothetical protein [Rhodococcus sp. B50]
MEQHPQGNDSPKQLPEERWFKRVLVGVGFFVTVFAVVFVVVTLVKSNRSPQDITSNWFVAWGTWAGGLGTAAAFLIAAFSLMVSSAHARSDRQHDAMAREDDHMAQARLLSIYKDVGKDSLSSLPTYLIENQSNARFFDVTVREVSSGNGTADIEKRTSELAKKDLRFGENIPDGITLHSHQDHTAPYTRHTIVRVHTTDAESIDFAVEYTDAKGRRWRQSLDGRIKRIYTPRAVSIPSSGRGPFDSATSALPYAAAWGVAPSLGDAVEEKLPSYQRPPLLTDKDFLTVVTSLATSPINGWKRVERIKEVKTDDFPSGERHISVTYSPIFPIWPLYFREKMTESGLSFISATFADKFRFNSHVEVFRSLSDSNAADLNNVVDDAIGYANDQFEANALAAAHRALNPGDSHKQLSESAPDC